MKDSSEITRINQRSAKIKFILLILALFGISSVFSFHSAFTKSAPSNAKFITPFPTPIIYPDIHTDNELTYGEYNRLKENLLNTLYSQSPKEALDKLNQLMDSDIRVSRSCHALAHEIGRNALIKYNNFTRALFSG